MKSTNYKFWAGPGGREVTRRIQRYKRHIITLYFGIGMLMAIAGILVIYIYNLSNGG